MPRGSEQLLDALFDHAEKPEFVYEHVWRVAICCSGTIAARRMRARIFPSTERRLMLRTTVKGTVRPY